MWLIRRLSISLPCILFLVEKASNRVIDTSRCYLRWSFSKLHLLMKNAGISICSIKLAVFCKRCFHRDFEKNCNCSLIINISFDVFRAVVNWVVGETGFVDTDYVIKGVVFVPYIAVSVNNFRHKFETSAKLIESVSVFWTEKQVFVNQEND